MSAYLDIAEKVIAQRRCPMGSHAILKDAYLLDLMPIHLHGETQHKTLQARLSEDILYLNDRSRFVRTEPGKFFLRCLLTDESIPAAFRNPITARRRKPKITPDPVLCVPKHGLQRLSSGFDAYGLSALNELLGVGDLTYLPYKETRLEHIPVWRFMLFTREEEVLSYRVGKYRSRSDETISTRTLGVTSLVTEYQQTLFNHQDLGILEAGVSALAIDLDFPLGSDILEAETSGDITMISVGDGEDVEAVLMVIEAGCPSWFEPKSRRLSMNDMKWIPFRVPPKHIEDFDPWTQAVVRQRFVCNE